jgi:uncharacterized membrane protein (DUF2068 family)
MDANVQTGARKNRAPTLYFIAICKLAKGALLLLLAVWIFSLSRQDLPDDFNRFLEWVRLDPEHSFFRNIAEWLATITPGNVRATALATFLYGIFLLVGGTGLVIRAKWAIWLTIGESAFFIPVEILELTRRHISPDPSDEPHPQLFPHRKIGLLIILALNIIVVSYLWKNRQRLFRHPD